MRILVITNMYPSERAPWAGIFVKEFVDQVRKYHEVDVASVGGSRKDFFSKIGKISLLTLKVLSRFPRRYDLIHAHYVFPPGFLSLLYKWRSTPIIVHCHGSDLYIRARGPLRPAVKFALRRADLVLCVSRELMDIAVTLGVDASKVKVLPMGVNVERITPLDKRTSRRKIGLPEDGVILTQIGALIERKRPLLSLKVFSELVSELAERKLYLVYGGDGPLYRELKEKTSSLGIEDRVFFLGGFPEYLKPFLYGASDVILLPSRQEAYGLVAAEALAAGRPIVASNVGGLREIVNHSVNGFLFNTRDDFKKHLATLISDEGLRERMGREGRLKALRSLSWEKRVKQLLEMYEQVTKS